jgi:hypothetical protein
MQAASQAVALEIERAFPLKVVHRDPLDQRAAEARLFRSFT